MNERTDLAVLNQTQMPAELLEMGFINSDADNQRLDTRFPQIAGAVAEGILATVWSA